MKPFYTAFMALAALSMLASGCAESQGIEEITEVAVDDSTASMQTMSLSDSIPVLSFDAVRDYLEQRGYDTATLTEREDSYRIGSDLCFRKSDLAELLAQPAPLINYQKKLSPEFYRRYINSIADFSLESTIIDAIQAWNTIEAWDGHDACSINFTSNVNGTEENRRARTELWTGYNISAHMELLSVEPLVSGGLCAKIWINMGHPLWGQIDNTQKKYLIMHALGHSIGLTHSSGDIFDDSIMRPEMGLEENKNLWSGFSTNDKSELRNLYRLTEPRWNLYTELTLPEKLKIGVKYTMDISFVYEWFVIHNDQDPYSCELECNSGVADCIRKGNSYELTFNKAGSCTLRITATDWVDGTPYVFERTFLTDVQEPTFICPDSIALEQFYDFKFSGGGSGTTYNFAVSEKLFDNNTDKSVTIQTVAPGHVRIRFNDCGSYRVRATAQTGSEKWEHIYCFTELYRPRAVPCDGSEYLGPINSPFSIQNESKRSAEGILIGDGPTIPHRMIFNTDIKYRQITFQNPGRPDYRLIAVEGSTRRGTLPKGAPYYLSVSYDPASIPDPDPNDTETHYTIYAPVAFLSYPYHRDSCQLLR